MFGTVHTRQTPAQVNTFKKWSIMLENAVQVYTSTWQKPSLNAITQGSIMA